MLITTEEVALFRSIVSAWIVDGGAHAPEKALCSLIEKLGLTDEDVAPYTLVELGIQHDFLPEMEAKLAMLERAAEQMENAHKMLTPSKKGI